MMKKDLFNKKRGSKIKRNSEFSADVVLGSGGEWPYTTTIRNGGSMVNGLYGSTSNNFIIHRAIPVTPNSIRNHPSRPNNLSLNAIRNSNCLRQSTTMLRLCTTSDGYCTVGRLYEEIPGNGTVSCEHVPYVAPPRRELIYGVSSIRRPPPNCRPPPPPSQSSLPSSDSTENSMEKELGVMHNVSSIKRSTDDDRSRNSGDSCDNGRESGYGTVPSRHWNSPMVAHHKRITPSQSEDITGRRQAPLAVYAHHSTNAHPMTYV